MKKTKQLVAIILSIMLIVSCFAGMSVSTANAAGNSKYSTEEVILHCWNWPISTIKAKLNDIKEAGYTAIQTSPINGIVGSGSSSADNTVSNWYQFYQPKNYTIGNKICTEDEFETFCSEAHDLGLKVIVDVVLNHTTDQTSQVSGIEKDYHGNGDISNWDDRWQQTQKNITGMPDLNTNNATLQSQAKALLRSIIAAGADGFRFDAAKHIELPSGDEISGCPTSNYWPTVLNGLNDKFSYGEVLGGQNCPFTGYAKYMNITGESYSSTVQNCARNKNFPAGDLTDYNLGLGGNNLVCWAESHDNYKGGNYGMPNSQIKLAWAAVTAQNLSTAYLARPYGSTTSNWQGTNKTTDGGDGFYFDKEVVAVNKFHNAAKGKSVSLENVGGNSQVLAVKRDNVGVCIINSSSSSKSISVGTSMPNGTYTDAANGGTFYVSNGTLTGTVGAGNVAAVFKEGSSSPTSSSSSVTPDGKYTVKFTNNKGWSNVYLYAWDGSGNTNAAWPGVKLTDKSTNDYGEEQYIANIDNKYTNIIFSNGSGTQTVDISNTTRDGSITGYYPKDQTNGKWTVGTWQVQGPTTPSTAAPTAAPTTEAPTEAPTIEPTEAPTEEPTEAPTEAPTVAPTEAPTEAPTLAPTEAPTTEAETQAPLDPEEYYTPSTGDPIKLTDTVQRAADDTTLQNIPNEFKNLQILGVQKKIDNIKKSVRFVTVVNNNILKDAQDYGYIAVGAIDTAMARSFAESYTLDTAPSGNVFCCKGKDNRISGDYGKASSNKPYKYVTFAVNNIADFSVAAVFYVKDKNGNVYYAPYTNSAGTTYKSCAVNWAALN